MPNRGVRTSVPLRAVAILLATAVAAGCAEPPAEEPPAPFDLDVYRFAYDGSDVLVTSLGAWVEHGWLVRMHNNGTEPMRVAVLPVGMPEVVYGPVGDTGGTSPRPTWLPSRVKADGEGRPPVISLAPGQAKALLGTIMGFDETTGFDPASPGMVEVGLHFARIEGNHTTGRTNLTWRLHIGGDGAPVVPDQHVTTRTVGVWPNGTSFYTNAPGLQEDPAFPAGFERGAFATDPLSVYVYEHTRDEQPAGSADHCYGTTIEGYNDLLLTQYEASTGVAFVRPEEAYTREGSEDHPLYGDPLIFLNTVMTHDGPVTLAAGLPDPLAPCFDVAHNLPPELRDTR